MDFFFLINYSIYINFASCLEKIDAGLSVGVYFLNWGVFYMFPQNVVFFFAIKFCAAVMFLVLIRGGTPRYRYDYLTKLG
jgi:NADH:ubiquinone oxidoreductase subunit H